MDIFVSAATSLIGVALLATAAVGYGVAFIRWYERIPLAVGALLLVSPGLQTDMIGIGVCILAISPMIFRYRKSLSEERC